MNKIDRVWPNDAAGKVPYWVYSDPEVYAAELERIWYGPHWLYCALEAEIPEVGDFKTTTLGERPVIVVRSGAGRGQRGGEPLRPSRGEVLPGRARGTRKDLLCPYHQWNYSLRGDLQGAPFRRGVRGQGGMPADFDPKTISLRKLRVEVVNGVVWATFSDATPPFRDYLGERFWQHYTRVYDGRKLEVLGYNRQHIPGNWKLMQENIKDPYHASLLHVFFVTFGLFRADQKSATEIDPTGRHGILISRKRQAGGQRRHLRHAQRSEATSRWPIRASWTWCKEFPGEDTVGMITVFPSVVLQQNINSLSTRHIVPTGPDGFDFHWTHWCYADDTPEMRLRRTRQANLFGPAGFVSADDSEIIEMSQQGFAHSPDEDALVMMGGREIESVEHMVTEVGIRGMYRYWREAMGL